MMNPLYLSGYGVKIRVEELKTRSNLVATDGREDYKNEAETYMFRPRCIPFDSIIIDGHSGYISLKAFHWLSRNNIPVFVLDFDGSLITSIMPPIPAKPDIRTAQVMASMNEEIRFRIAYSLVEAKIRRSLDVLEYIAERYDISQETVLVRKEATALSKASTVSQVRTVEGRTALRYWPIEQSFLSASSLRDA